MMKKCIISITLLLSVFTALTQTVIFPTGSSWKYNDSGSNLGTSWASSSYNDASWSSGNAILGYGTINAGTIVTTVSYGGNSSSKYATTYFRKSFSYTTTGNETYYQISALIDDGAVLYINGVEIKRINMPSGTVSYTTYAASTGNEDSYSTFTIPASAVQNGTNIFAVEVHQVSGTSSDIGLDISLEAHFDLDIKFIHLGSTDNPLNRLRITWRDNTGVDSIQWGYSTSYSQGKFKAKSRELYTDSLYEYSFPPLTANATIHYSIYSASYGVWSQDMSFETSANPSSNHFNIAVLGDSRTNLNDWNTVSSLVPACDFVLFTGDIVSNGSVTSDWDDWFSYGDDFIKSHLVYHALGNHEAQSGGYANDTNLFVLPESPAGKELYYSFTMGNTIIIALNSEDPGDATQYNWLLSTLAANVDKTWKIVFFHKPFYTSPTHTTDMHGYFNTWWKAFDDYGVDLIFNGHTHNYQRTKPINRNISTTSAVDYYGSCTNSGRCEIVTGRAGAPGYGVGSGWFIQETSADLNYVMMDINEDSCTIVARNSSSTIIDSFRLVKDFRLSLSSTPEGPIGASNGTATVAGAGGNSPYTYLWETSSTAATISNLDSGWYSVVGKSADLCEVTDSVYVDTTSTALYLITDTATNIQINSATLNATIKPPSGGVLFGLQYDLGTSTSYGTTITSSPNWANSNSITTGSASGLTAGTTYHYRIEGTDGSTTYYGADESFTTLSPSAATITIGSDFTNVSGTIAENTGNEVSDDGGANITERGMVYSTSPNPTYNNLKKTASGTIGLFDISLLNLNYGTTYYSRAYAINSIDTSYSATEKSFTTEPQTQAIIDSVVRDISDPTYATVYFTYGNGDGFMLIFREDADVDQFPVDGTSPDDYFYNANYGQGYHLGNGNYVAYNGSHSKGDITVGNLNNSKDYYFSAFEYSGSGTNANYRTNDAATTSTDQSNLPIVLIDFSAVKRDSVVDIFWTTASELNNRVFEVQKSDNGVDFITFDKVAGAGNSHTIHNYTSTDKKPLKGICYYRLRQIDFDGKSSLSQVISENTGFDKSSYISHIISGDGQISFHYYSQSNSRAIIELTDISGKIVYMKNISEMNNRNISIPMQSLSSGVYFIRLKTQNQILYYKLVY